MSGFRLVAHLATTFLVIGAVVVGCGRNWESPPPYTGQIISMDYRIEVFVPAEDTVEVHPAHSLKMSAFTECEGPRKSIMVIGHDTSELGTPSGAIRHPVFNYYVTGSRFELVTVLSDNSYFCKMLDYLDATQQYLYVGTYASKSGIFILDSSFAMVRYCNDLAFGTDTSGARDKMAMCRRGNCGAYFLTSSSILVSWDDGTFVVNLDDSTSRRIGDRMCITAISHDRTCIVERARAPQEHWLNIRDARTGQILHSIGELSKPSECCFSPDDRILAFTQIEGFFDTGRIWLYDTENRKLYRTKATPNRGSSLIWIE